MSDPQKPPNNKGRRVIKVNALTQAHLIKLLLDGEMDCKELAEETGLHYVTVLQYTRELHRAKAAHICKWLPDDRGVCTIKVYKLGTRHDARRPKLTDAERQARVREARKKLNDAAVLNGAGQYVQAANGRLRFEKVTT